MDEKTNAQTLAKREVVEDLDQEFARLHADLSAILQNTAATLLYKVTAPAGLSSLEREPAPPFSVGESVLRSAAVVEQTFGGITANLWDDPFEWTLPEYLTTPEKIKEHLTEVETIRRRAFASFVDDTCLTQHIATPSGETRPLIDVLSEALQSAAHYQHQALVALKLLSANTPTGFII